MKLRKRDDVSLLEATCIFPEDPSSLLVLDSRLSFLSESCYLTQVSFALLGQEIEILCFRTDQWKKAGNKL